MQDQYDLKAAVDALARPRILHTAQPAPTAEEPNRLEIVSIQHPPLLDLLEHGLGTANRGQTTGRSSRRQDPIDAGALEEWGQIRDQVREWLRQLNAPWSDDLKTDLLAWHARHELAVARGRVTPDHAEYIARVVTTWEERIERKYDPDEKREWTEACPAVFPIWSSVELATGETVRVDTGGMRRCGARRIKLDGVLQFAIQLNITQREAHCRACGTKWEGQRGLMHLRYETNLWTLDRDLEAARRAQAAESAPEPRTERRELALTGPIDLP